MVDELFTNVFPKAREQSLNEHIKDDIKSLRRYFNDQEIGVLQGPAPDALILSFSIKVNIPSRGTVNGIPIKPSEPVFLLIDKNRYPAKAPSAFSNRLDFPGSSLPHLNPVPKGTPSFFCLHRGNIDDWFAEHTLIDFVERIQSWLNDAAANKLIREKDEYEITRINQSFGYTIFEEAKYLNYLKINYDRNNNQSGYSVVLFELLKDSKNDPLIKKDSYAIKHKLFIRPDKISEVKEIVTNLNKLVEKSEDARKQLIGVFCYPDKSQVYKEYFSEIPDRLGEFLNWTDSLKIPARIALQKYLSDDLQFLGGIPLSIVIRRPTKVIKHSTNIEILNFLILASGEHWPKEGKFNDDTEVILMDQRHPITLEYARDLSSFKKDDSIGKTLLLGCGALGSKIALHLIKSGQADFSFWDNDELSPHNLIRHGLLSNSLGLNKAEALKNEVEKMYYAETDLSVQVIKESALSLLSNANHTSVLKPYKNFIDASASNSIFNLACDLEFSSKMKYYRCELTNKGDFGLFFSEGKERNPRVDDLQMFVYDLSMERNDISKWLQANKTEQENLSSRNEEIMVGMSCSSDTTKVSDEVISFHASVMASAIRKSSSNQTQDGIIQFSKNSPLTPESLFSVQQFNIKPFDIIKFKNDSRWMVRMKSGLKEEMISLLKKDFPNETGGLLLGRLNPKTKVVHITRVLPAPPDSKKLPYLFVRGKVGVPLQIRRHRNMSGGLIDFVGEWHTHPNGVGQMSSTDFSAVDELRKFLDPIPYPTIVLIVTPNKVNPFIFGPK